MVIAKVRVNAVSAETLSCTHIPRGAVGCAVAFEFADRTWDGLTKTVVFRNSGKTLDAVLKDNCAVIPHELLVKVNDIVYVGVYGTDTGHKLAVPTVWAKLGQVESAANATGDPAADPSLPVWAQVMESVEELRAEKLDLGDLEAALIQAKENGDFTGPKGDTPVRGEDYWTAEDRAAIVDQSARAAVEAVGQVFDIVCTAGGSEILLTDSASRELKNLRVYGKTVQNGVPTPENRVPLECVGNGGSVNIRLGNGETEEMQSCPVAKAGGLPGIPVTSGGNYTDGNGQRWICDEIDFARGVYVQRVGTYTTGESTKWYANGGENSIGTANLHLYIIIGTSLDRTRRGTLCDRFSYYATAGTDNESKRNVFRNYTGQGTVIFDVDKNIAATLEAWKSYVAENPLTIQYILATPVETPISQDSLSAYAALRTYKTDTAVTNDAGAYMAVDYVADPKAYIDNRIAAMFGTADTGVPDTETLERVEPEITEIL